MKQDAVYQVIAERHKDLSQDPFIELADAKVTVYGAFARAEALAAGDSDWMNVTEWPREQIDA